MKKIKILIVLTALYLVIWVIAAFTYSLTHGMPEKLPIAYVTAIVGVFIFWLLIGLYALVRYFKTIKTEIIKFINE